MELCYQCADTFSLRSMYDLFNFFSTWLKRIHKMKKNLQTRILCAKLWYGTEINRRVSFVFNTFFPLQFVWCFEIFFCIKKTQEYRRRRRRRWNGWKITYLFVYYSFPLLFLLKYEMNNRCAKRMKSVCREICWSIFIEIFRMKWKKINSNAIWVAELIRLIYFIRFQFKSSKTPITSS